MDDDGILHIAEIPYEDGTIRFRYARILSADGTRWIKHGLFSAHHPNGTLSAEGMYVNGQEHGLWTEYHSNGQMAAKGYYANGKRWAIGNFGVAMAHRKDARTTLY